MTEGLEAALIFMGPPVVALVAVVISTTKIYQETIKILKSYLEREVVTRLYNVTSALQRFTMRLCSPMISFYRKLLLISLTFIHTLLSKCLTWIAKLVKLNQSIQHKDNMQKQLPWNHVSSRTCKNRRNS